MTLTGDDANPAEARGRRADEAAVKVMRVQNVKLLSKNATTQTRELLKGIRTIKASQWKLRDVGELGVDLFVIRSFIAKHSETHVEAFTIESLEQLACQALRYDA